MIKYWIWNSNKNLRHSETGTLRWKFTVKHILDVNLLNMKWCGINKVQRCHIRTPLPYIFLQINKTMPIWIPLPINPKPMIKPNSLLKNPLTLTVVHMITFKHLHRMSCVINKQIEDGSLWYIEWIAYFCIQLLMLILNYFNYYAIFYYLCVVVWICLLIYVLVLSY